MNNDTDDGSLAFLGIGKDPSNIQFHCEQVKASKLVNTTFWVRNIIENIKTSHGEERMLVLISIEKDAPESECQKFFTNSRYGCFLAMPCKTNLRSKPETNFLHINKTA